MYRLLLTALALLVTSSVDANERATPEHLDEWVTYYYVDPQPTEVPAALRAVTEKGLFEDDKVQAPLSGFFAEVFRANPERLNDWVAPYVGVQGRHIIYSGLWMANSKESRAALELLAAGAAPEEAKELRGLLAMLPPTVESMPINSPASLDYLWGCFFASGADAPVVRIIDQLKLVNVKGNIGKMLIGGAANWSVSANARQHERVLKIVKARLTTADPETKTLLKEILRGRNAKS